MLPVTIQHPDGVVYHFYRSDHTRRPKGQRVIFPRNNESKAAKFISLFKPTDLLKIQLLLDKKDLSRLPPRKALAKAISEGRIVVYEEREKDDASDAEMALLRLDIKLLLKQIVSIEKDEAAKIEKDLKDKNVVEKILIYKQEYNKGFAKAAIELLTWVKDLHEVVSPTENLKRALDAGWETYRSDSKDWQETFYTKLKASNYKEVVDALGFDPGKLSKEQIVQVFEFAQLISEDDKTQEIILGFIKEYIGAQHSLEWANFAGGAAFDIVLTALLAFFTAGVGAAAAVSAKAGRLMKPLAKLGEKFSELAKKLSKKFKPRMRKKTKVGGSGNRERAPEASNSPKDSKNNYNEKNSTEDSKDRPPPPRPSYPVETDPDTAFFWSGKTDGAGGEKVAAEIASDNGGTTLETLIDERDIKMPEWDTNNPGVVQEWKNISADYANGASGTVRAVVGNKLRPGNVWETAELPALMKNPNVDKIITIDPLTKVETVIFVR